MVLNKRQNQICQNCKQDFVIEPDDFGFYEKMAVPAPTFCSDCRFQRRLLFRNNRVFYKRECQLCGKSVIGLYNKNRSFSIYCHDCWFSDKWDVMSYGQEYDFSLPFFEQFKSLQEEFKFYKRMNLPLPRRCPNCRHYARIKQRNPLKLWERNCMCSKENHFHGKEKCVVEFKTSYSPDRSEIVYCEKCYQQEVY